MNPALRLLLATTLACSPAIAPAQTDPSQDSLLRQIATARPDTNKVNLYWKAAANVIYQDSRSAVPLFRQGFHLAQQLKWESGMEKCLNGTSLAFSLNSNYDSALVYINAAIPHALKAAELPRLTLVYLNRADVYNNLSNFPAALKDCDTAIQYAHRSGNENALGRIYGIMSGIQISLKQYQEGGANIDKSMDYFTKAGNQQMLALMLSDKADLFMRMGQERRGIPLLQRAIIIADSVEDVEGLSSYHGTLGDIYLKLDDFKRAKPEVSKSLDLARETGNIRQQAAMLTSMSKVEQGLGHHTEALQLAREGYDLIRQEKDLEREMIAARQVGEAYRSNGNYEQALHFANLSNDMNDSLLHRQFQQETANQHASFFSKEKDREIELLNSSKTLAESQIRNQQLMMGIGGVVVLLIVGGIGFFVYRSRIRQQMKQLELRSQIAADLHDEVGSSLSSINMLSQLMAKQSDPAMQKALIEKVTRNSREVMDKMGDVVWMIKPGESEEESLMQRVERFAYEIADNSDLPIQLELGALEHVKLTMKQRKNIYLIFKEALNNAAKYAGAKTVRVRAERKGPTLLFAVIDDGRGLPVQSEQNKGNGLGNMTERAREIGGQVIFTSEPGKGTKVLLKLNV